MFVDLHTIMKVEVVNLVQSIVYNVKMIYLVIYAKMELLFIRIFAIKYVLMELISLLVLVMIVVIIV